MNLAKLFIAIPLLISGVSGVWVNAAEGQPPSASEFMNNPEWRNRFLASYGVDSDTEPKISDKEIELFQDLLELIKINPRAAAARLKQEIKPESSPALIFVLGNLYFQDGDIKQAAEQYEAAIKKNPDFRRAHSNLGLIYVQQGDYKKAIQHLGKSVQLGDRDPRSYGLLGYSYLSLEDYLAAEQAYRNAILQDPDNKDWVTGLARTLLELEDYAAAKALIEKTIKEKPTDPKQWMLLANTLIGLEQPRKAAAALEMAVSLGEKSAKTLSLLGDIYLQQDLPGLATRSYASALEFDKSVLSVGKVLRAAKLLYQTGAYGESKELTASIREISGDELSDSNELELLTLEAQLARVDGNEEAAAGTLELIVSRDGTRGDALIELADYYFGKASELEAEKGESDQPHSEAVELRQKGIFKLEQAQKLSKFERKALVKHAQYLVSQREYRDAVSLLQKALQIEDEPRLRRFLDDVSRAARAG